MITPYNVKAFANIATRAIAELLMQGKFAVEGNSCSYLLENGSRCAIGLVIDNPDPNDPPLSGDPKARYPASFLARLEAGTGFVTDDHLLRLLALLQTMHDSLSQQHYTPSLDAILAYRAPVVPVFPGDTLPELAGHFNSFMASLRPSDFELQQYRYLGKQGELKMHFNCTAPSMGQAHHAIRRAHPEWELDIPTIHPPHTYMDEVEL